MNETVREWVGKADGDFGTAARELGAEGGNFDAVCFHAQQCIEKLLKAVLIAHQVVPPRTHDLLRLDALVREVAPAWTAAVADLRRLGLAVAYRYPGEAATREDAQAAYETCTRLRAPLLALLMPGT